LRYAYFITCTEIVKSADGEIVELRCTYDPATKGGNAPDGRKVKATMHWVSAPHAVTAEVRQYEHLFTTEAPGVGGNYLDDINQKSFTILQDCQLEPALAKAPVGSTLQFERLGYYCADPDGTPERPVFNRTVGLRDTWAKVQRQQASDQQNATKKKG
jgi:glutaminyl-tRNA synthetase